MRNVLISHTTILAARMSITVGFAECIPNAQTQTNEGYERCEVLTAVLINIRVLWDMTTCRLVCNYRHCGASVYLPSSSGYSKKRWISFTALKIEAAMSFETSIIVATRKFRESYHRIFESALHKGSVKYTSLATN